MDTPLPGQAPENPTEDVGTTQGQEPGAERDASPDVDALMTEVKSLRREAASWRTKLRQAEEAEEQRKRSEMTELEKLKADLEAERQARAKAEEQRRGQLLRTQVITAAARIGFNDPDDALRMIDAASLEVDDQGAVDGLDAALQALAKAKPYLIKSTTGTISPTNPAGGPQRTTQEQLRQEMFGPKNTKLFEGGGVFWSQE